MLLKMFPLISFVVLTSLLLAACQPPAQTVVAVTVGTPQVIVQVVTATPSPPTDTPVPPTLPMLTPAPTWRPLGERADLKNDQGPVYSQGWSPDGKLLATAGYGQVSVWNVASSQRVAALKQAGYIWGLAWSPDGARLASASQDGTVKLWDKTYRESATLDTGWAFCVGWSPDGKQLAVGTEAGSAQIWDVKTGKLARKLSGSSLIISIAWSPDGRTLAVGQWDGVIALRAARAETGVQLKSLVGTTAKSDVNGLAWSPDGRRLAFAHQDGKVRLWSAQDGQLLRSITAHRGWARGIAWSPDGRWLASTGEDKWAYVWDPDTGDGLAGVKHNVLPVWSVAWSPDGKYVSTGSGAYEQLNPGTVIVWSTSSLKN